MPPSSSPDALPSLAESNYYGLANLLRLNFAGVDLRPLCQKLLKKAAENPDDSCSLMDAAILLQFYGNPTLAKNLQREALKLKRLYRQPITRTPRLKLLALVAPGDLMANVPIECLLEDSDIELTLYFTPSTEIDPAQLPEHDVLFVAFSETEANRPLLTAWTALLKKWPGPVLNRPAFIERVARDTAAELLASLPGVLVPTTLRCARTELARLADARAFEATADESVFPLLIRPVDSHAGHDFHKVDHAADLAAVLDTLPGEEFFVSSFIDYRNQDGQFRKYRVILIDGKPFACHMGVSSHWMIHYLNAGMADSPEKRAEEARFMANFAQEFSLRHQSALADIARVIGLDYLGIDCAEMPDGRLLIFEIDPAMVVHAMDPIEVYPYKQDTMHKLFAAFRALLCKAAGKESF